MMADQAFFYICDLKEVQARRERRRDGTDGVLAADRKRASDALAKRYKERRRSRSTKRPAGCTGKRDVLDRIQRFDPRSMVGIDPTSRSNFVQVSRRKLHSLWSEEMNLLYLGVDLAFHFKEDFARLSSSTDTNESKLKVDEIETERVMRVFSSYRSLVNINDEERDL